MVEAPMRGPPPVATVVPCLFRHEHL